MPKEHWPRLFKIVRFNDTRSPGDLQFSLPPPEPEPEAQPTEEAENTIRKRFFSGTLRTDGVSAHWVIDRPVSDCVTRKIVGYPESSRGKKGKSTPPDLKPYLDVMKSGRAIYVDPGRRDLATAISDSQVNGTFRRAISKVPANHRIPKKATGKAIPANTSVPPQAKGKRKTGEKPEAGVGGKRRKGKDGMETFIFYSKYFVSCVTYSLFFKNTSHAQRSWPARRI